MSTTINTLFARGVDLTGRLAARLGDAEPDFCEVAVDLHRMAEVLECLPLDQADYCFYRNRLLGTADLIDAGEHHAARWQTLGMHRRLTTLAKQRHTAATTVSRPLALARA